VKKLICI